MGKTAKAPADSSTLSWWWEDPRNVQNLIPLLVKEGELNTGDDITAFLKDPKKFNKHYEFYLQKGMLEREMQRPATTEFFDDRWYPIGDDQLESITTIEWAYPSPGLVNFIGAVGTGEAELRKVMGARRGSKVHDAIQQNGIIERKNFTDEEYLCLIHAKLFHDQYKPVMVLNEQWCWSLKHHYAGRFDRIVLIKGVLQLLDWKTGFVGREAELQLAAEVRAIEEMMPLQLESTAVVALNDRTKAGWSYRPIEERSEYVEALENFMSGSGIAPSWTEAKRNEAIAKAKKQAFREVLRQDLAVFDATHEVWKDCFRAHKPKQYPMFPVPNEIDLSIPLSDEVVIVPPKLPQEEKAAPEKVLEDKAGGVNLTADRPDTTQAILHPEGQAHPGPQASPEPEKKREVIPVDEMLARELQQFIEKGTLAELEAWYASKKPYISALTMDQVKKFGEDYGKVRKKCAARKK